ncbi:MAG: HAD family phosphatase [Defluviitaleaceae bacterium]|nr:HAD family phosphatase [Defluviitaleaceae bacterium]
MMTSSVDTAEKFMFKGAIFDLDGTLINSMGVWEKIDIDFLAKRGISAPKTYFEEISTLSFREMAKYTIDRFNLDDSVEGLLQEWHEMAIDEYSHNIWLKPYAKDYLTLLKSHDIKLATATSLSRTLAEPVLRNNGIWDFFDVQCFTDEVERGKAFPDVYLLAAKKLNILPQHCVVFEDLPQGITSAKNAGMKVVGVYDDVFKAHWKHIMQTADAWIHDYQDVLNKGTGLF